MPGLNFARSSSSVWQTQALPVALVNVGSSRGQPHTGSQTVAYHVDLDHVSGAGHAHGDAGGDNGQLTVVQVAVLLGQEVDISISSSVLWARGIISGVMPQEMAS